MKLKVNFYAVCRDLTNSDSCEIDLPVQVSKKDAIETIVQQFPALEKIAQQLALAVNNRYVMSEITLNEGDEISIIPPVSGG